MFYCYIVIFLSTWLNLSLGTPGDINLYINLPDLADKEPRDISENDEHGVINFNLKEPPIAGLHSPDVGQDLINDVDEENTIEEDTSVNRLNFFDHIMSMLNGELNYSNVIKTTQTTTQATTTQTIIEGKVRNDDVVRHMELELEYPETIEDWGDWETEDPEEDE